MDWPHKTQQRHGGDGSFPLSLGQGSNLLAREWQVRPCDVCLWDSAGPFWPAPQSWRTADLAMVMVNPNFCQLLAGPRAAISLTTILPWTRKRVIPAALRVF